MTTTAMLLDSLDADSRSTLQRYRFDEATFLDLAARFRTQEGLDGADNAVQGTVEPPDEGALDRMVVAGDPRRAELEARGREAIAAGHLAAVVLNGGMATRFGGVVKGVVEALPGRSFLQLAAAKLRRAGASAGGTVPLLLMNSFATDETTREHVVETGHLGVAPSDVLLFAQFVFPRLAEDGGLFVSDDGRCSLYGPGHGDVIDALRLGGAVECMTARGVRHVAVYNVDNLGAGPDPLVLGQHLAGGRPATVELVEKAPGDKGGAPALVNGHLEIVEDFRFPAGFDQDRIGVFNTNTFIFNIEVLEQAYPLDWFTVRKNVGGRAAIQFEHLVGQVTAFLDAHYLVVPREGVESRFLPVKRPDDLAELQPLLRSIFGGNSDAH